MKTEIWKLQRPLFTNGDYLEVMAYTEGREQVAMIPFTTELIDEVFGDEPKVYVKGKVKRGNLVVDEIVEEQPW